MNVAFRIDPSTPSGLFRLMIRPEAPLLPDAEDLIDEYVESLCLIVSARGLPVGDNSPTLKKQRERSAPPEVNYSLKGRSLHPSVWRILLGGLTAFDTASATLSSVVLEQDGYAGAPAKSSRILALPYPTAATNLSFPFENTPHDSEEKVIEIALTKGTKSQQKKKVIDTINAWLALCQGGFFMDGQDPVENYHDCPEVNVVSPNLLVVSFDVFAGHSAAFDVLLNAVDYFSRTLGCIDSVRKS